MRYLITCVSVLFIFVACEGEMAEDDVAVVVFPPAEVVKTNTTTKVLAHYMPWFQSKEYDGFWGIHWTMANRNPEMVDHSGRRQIASHFYPLIGPYSSSDPDLIEYHLLLMKLSGIDGVLIDWYGTYPIYDYPDNLKAADALIDMTDKVGLQFGVVYEDRTTSEVVNNGLALSPVVAAQNDFSYMQRHYFGKNHYLKNNGRPIVPIFTPVHIQKEADWLKVVENLSPQPLLLSIWEESNDLGAAGSGEYAWVYNGLGNHSGLLAGFYALAGRFEMSMGSAYPGFKDFYREGGWGSDLAWSIDHNGIQTLVQALQLAAQYRPEYLQLVTWNDFGEGTMLEPTMEFGYTHLEQIQKFTGVPYTVHHLELVKRLYDLRKRHADDEMIQRKLDQVFYYFVSLQMDKVERALGRI